MAASILASLAVACCRRAWLVTLCGLLLIGGCGFLAAHRLGLNSDLDTLFAASLPWKQRDTELKRDFPQFSDLLVAVVDGDLPEQTDETAAQLAAALSADKIHFRSVTRPDAVPFLQQNGLLFLDQPKLEALLNQTITAQPFLGQLAADPSARGLFAALSLMGMGVQAGQADLKSFAPALQAFHKTLAAAADGKALPLSWENLLSGSLVDMAGQYRFVLVQPHLDYGALEPGGAATAALRDAISKLPGVRDGSAHVHITGSVALSDEEIGTATQGALSGLLISTALVAVWLLLAVRSWRLIVPIMGTLFLGLSLTTGFATLAVGTLNLISIAFAVLFVGIAVDFAIQFSVRFRDMRLHLPDMRTAIAETTRRVGLQILIAASATAAGFLAFVPTAFVGVAQLGLIAGVGMLIAFFCTVTFLPAALTVCAPRPEQAEVGFAYGRVLDRVVMRASRPLLAVFIILMLAGAVMIPRITFDSDPLHTKDPHTEAMQTLRKLMADPRTNPYSIDILCADADQADALAERLRALPLVQEVLTLDSFVPQDQPAKLAFVADASNILQVTLAPQPHVAPVTADDLRLAITSTLGQLTKALAKLPPNDPLVAVVADLRQLQAGPDSHLLQMNTALTRFLPAQLDRLRVALNAGPVTRASLPPEVAQDWRAPDGRIRVQVTAKPGVQGSAALHQFVRQVSQVAPNAGGSAVTITATADTVVTAFRNAAIGAIIAIALILSLALRRVLDVLLVLAPLLLSACLTVLLLVLLPLPLNFANVIALPLLLGVGVSFNIYFVMNWRAGQAWPLGSATARAVVFSALTTATAFGSLALSRHPGTASMGILLLISLGCTLVASLVFVPALLAVLGPPRLQR